MQKRKKILVITGTRADYGLLRPVIDRILKSKKLELKLLVTGMHTLKKFGNTMNVIKKDGYFVNATVSVGESGDMNEWVAEEIIGINKYCKKEKPDIMLLLGDRGEMLAGAIVAGHLKIPIAHIHGGDVTGPVVDEYIRHSITKFSHLHFTVSEKSRNRVIKLGEESWRVFNRGAPGLDEFRKTEYLSKPEFAKMMNLDVKKRWLILIQHSASLDSVSVEKQINPTISAVSDFDGEKIIIYPNSDTGHQIIINAIEKLRGMENVHIYKNLPRDMYINLLKHGSVLVGNSSSGILESSFFMIPTINIGNRQKNRDCDANVIHVGYEKTKIKKAIQVALSEKFHKKMSQSSGLYGDGNAGKKIVTIIEKYASFNKLFEKEFTYA